MWKIWRNFEILIDFEWWKKLEEKFVMISKFVGKVKEIKLNGFRNWYVFKVNLYNNWVF